MLFERKVDDQLFARRCVRFQYRDSGHKYGNFPGKRMFTSYESTGTKKNENTHTHTEYYKFNPTNLRMKFMNKTLFTEMMQNRYEQEERFRFLVRFSL